MFKNVLKAGTAALFAISSVVALQVSTSQIAAAETVVELAAGADGFSTLVAAVTAADLVETLNGEGPFTVFAPTDTAFAALPAGTVENLLKPENKDQLVSILTYHVLPGIVAAADVPTQRTEVATVNGASMSVLAADGAVTIDGATVIAADLRADNGIVHVIDSVIIPGAFEVPVESAMMDSTEMKSDEMKSGDMASESMNSDDMMKSEMNLAETAIAAGSFNTLVAALQAAGMDSGVAHYDSYTVFAPTDDAFAALPEGTVETLLKPENKQQLINVLAYHLVDGTVMAGDIPSGATNVDSLLPGQFLAVENSGNGITISGANVVTADVKASNGVIHVIDSVLLPSDATRKTH